jgi:hypothetical protein
MSYFEGNSKILLTSVVGVMGLGSLMYYLTGSGTDDDLLPALTLQETQDILSKILERIKILSVRYARASQQIQQQVAQQGQQMSEHQINQHFILPHFETGFEEAEIEVLAEFDCDSDELEEAGRYYALKEKDEVVRELLNKLKRLHQTFGGESDMTEFSDESEQELASRTSAGGGGGDITLAKVVEVLKKLSDMVGDATDDYCENFKMQYGLPTNAELAQQFQGGMLQMSEAMEAQVLQSYGMTQAQFQAGIMAHQSDATLLQVIQDMQVKNQQRLLNHGISMQ